LTKKREKLADMLYDAILKSVMESELKEGDRLPGEEALSEKYNVSRPTIREVLARLRAGGWIVSRQGSGSYVGRPPTQSTLRFPDLQSVADIQQCFEFRRGIESGAAELAARVRDEDGIARIEAAYTKLNDAIQRGEVGLDEDFALHLAIASASKNKYFVSMLNSIREQALFAMTLSRDLSRNNKAERRLRVQNEHRAVIDAIVRRDPAGALRAMNTHIDCSMERIFIGDRK
jgi:GntR family transcriptional repressor for pyruvate dehydrogenase complex